nr:RNA-directed DNA polymerase, eukaryota, reverse transcriptase zinc-binding domain protein [Tanacetum cinerariifolium]
MGGYKLNRVDRYCTKGSRLDRFLIADSTWNSLGPLTAVALDRSISEHDYGPIPFKIFHSSFQVEGFDNLESGLRQRDPLAPFLFILAMEGFHIAMKDVIEAKKFSGINIGDICLSHLIYVDDVIVLGEWSQSNMVRKHVGPWNNIMQILSNLYNAGLVPSSAMQKRLEMELVLYSGMMFGLMIPHWCNNFIVFTYWKSLKMLLLGIVGTAQVSWN